MNNKTLLHFAGNLILTRMGAAGFDVVGSTNSWPYEGLVEHYENYKDTYLSKDEIALFEKNLFRSNGEL